MLPGTIPALPITVFPAIGLPSFGAGLTAVDVTAALAVLLWAVGGLVALRVAIRMSQEPIPATVTTPPTTSPTTTHPAGLKDAA